MVNVHISKHKTVNIQEKLKTIDYVAKEHLIGLMGINILALGKIIKEKDTALFTIHLEINMKENGKMI